MRRLNRLLGGVIGCTLALMSVGCGSGASDSDSNNSANDDDSVDVRGKTYIVTDVTGHTQVPGSQIALTFGTDGMLGVHAGCNQMSGQYTLADDVLNVTGFAMTEMACEQPLMDQDRWAADLLSSGPTISFESSDTIVITSGAGTMTLQDREVADPDRPLEGTTWEIHTIVTGDAASSLPVGTSASFVINDGRLDVRSGCNTGSGSVEFTDTTLTLGPIATTRKACEEELMQLEATVLGVLDGELSYAIEADQITLATSAGDGLRASARQ